MMYKLYPKIKDQYCSTFLKVLFIILLLTFSQKNALAQTVAYYDFSQSTGTYSGLDNPILIAEPTAQTGTGSIDDQVYTLADGAIPFDFSFNEMNYTGLNVYANGFISFGSITTNNSTPISSSIQYEGVIAPFAADLVALHNAGGLTGNIVYQVLGTAPNREFVVQWSHFTPYSFSGYATSRFDLSFQVRLHENGTINFVYDGSYIGTPLATNAKVGLRGSSNSDYTNRYASGSASNNWFSSETGTNSSNGIATNYSNSMPPSGLTFTWTPPSACTSPVAQPTDLVLTNTGIIINGSFTGANPSVDRYLVLRNTQGETPNPPINGTIYTTGQNESLDAYAVYYGANTSFENNYNHGIRGNTEYVYTIYSVNSDCAEGPLYYTANPLTENITNCPIALNGITANNPGTASFQLSWPEGENGNAFPMLRVIEVATDMNFANMVTGSPFTLTADDLSLIVSGLNPNTQYFYRGKNTTSLCESTYSSTGNIYTLCVPVSEFSEGFDGVTGNMLPNCWSKITIGTGSSTPTVNVTPTSDYVYSAPNGVTFYGNGADLSNLDNKAILVSPQLTNTGNGTHRLRFRAKKSTASGTHAVRVVALSSNTADAEIEVIGTIPTEQLTASWQQFSVNFDNYTGIAAYVGIQRIDGATYSYMSVDDVAWEPIPVCSDLQNLSATNPTVNGATISWTVNGTVPADGYEYFISESNSIPAESETFIAADQSNVTVSNLSASTTYYVFVRSVCSSTEKGAWEVTSFSTVQVASVPWQEEFLTSTFPSGWTNGAFTLGTVRGATGTGNSATNLYKNLWSSTTTGNFTTIAVGPLDTNNYELSFYYKQSNYNSPYASLTDWGNFTVEVSTDFGATWITIGTVDNEAGTGDYIQKVYSLADYQDEYVQVKITANRTAGDFDISFDNFEIKQQGEENPFCLPVFEYNANGEMITQVIFNTIDNVSPFTSGTTPQYEDFTAISTDIEQGSTHQISVKGPASTYPSDVMVYIDFNQNGDFSDDGEGFYIGRLQPANPANANTITSTITIPATALAGTTKMRIVKNSNVAALSDPDAPNSISGPCADDLRAGQVEEYTINITEIVTEEFPAPYCGFDEDTYYDIEPVTLVNFGTIDNSSSEVINASPLLENFTNISTEVVKGATYMLTVKGNTAGDYENHITAYIDWNQNNVFDASELHYIGVIENSTGTDNISVSSGITVPAEAVLGSTRMRIVKSFDDNAFQSSCGALDYGQAEDYTIVVTQGSTVPVVSVNVTTQNSIPAEITVNSGTLQLEAVVTPDDANPFVIWSIENGGTLATINSQGLITSIANGTVTVRATSVADNTKFGEIEITISNQTVQTEYCDVSVEWDVEPVTLVNFANLNNPTSAVINGTPAYEDFTSMVAHVEQGQTYTMTVKGNTGNFTHDIRVFIDWNQNFIFDMATEYYHVSLPPSTGEDNVMATIDITIPIDATLGNTRMRITKDHWNVYTEGQFDACTDAYYGQIEDYTINISDGSAIIVIDSVNVSVQNNVSPEITIQDGTLQLIATVNPNEANQEVIWSVASGSEFASVDQNGLITAIANGTVTVRATSVEDETVYGEIEILIDYEVIIPVENVVVSVQNDLAPEIIIENGSLQLIATVNPSDVNQEVVWSVVSGNDFASVDQNGLVTAIANGTATVRAASVEDETKFDEIEITINYEVIIPVESVVVTVEDDLAPEIITESGTLQLIATVNPSDANQEVIWSVVAGGEFALVSEGGLITAITNGIVTIRATSVEDETKFGEIDVVVNITLSADDIKNPVFKLYPNPTNGIVNIETSEMISSIILFDVTGKQILSQSSTQIDLAEFPTGIYFVKIYLENNSVITEKIIKK